MSKIDSNTLLVNYYNLYQFHAGQRMKILEIFISAEVILYGAWAAMLKKTPYLSVFASIAGMLVALICLMMDNRTRDLMHECRLSIRQLENLYIDGDNGLQLFNNIKDKETPNSDTENDSTEKTINDSKITKFFNYSKIFRLIYGIGIASGFILAILA